jgi:hypothetical protein
LVLELIICKAQYTSCMYTITAMVKLGCQVQVLLLFSEIWASAVFLVFRMDIVVFENIVLTHPCSNCQGNTACSLSFLPIKCPHGHLHGLALHRRMDCCEIWYWGLSIINLCLLPWNNFGQFAREGKYTYWSAVHKIL